MNGEEERNLYDQILPFARAVEVSIDSVVVTDLFTLSLRVCVHEGGGGALQRQRHSDIVGVQLVFISSYPLCTCVKRGGNMHSYIHVNHT